MKEEISDTGNVQGLGLCDLVVVKLKEIGVRTTKVKKIKCLLQKQEEKEPPPTTFTFGVGLDEQQMASSTSGSNVPRFLHQATQFLSDHLTSENIFRKNGLLRRQKELKKIINQGGTFEGASVDDVASLYKQWFRELPEPIFPFLYHDLFFRCFEICKERGNNTAVLLACLLLPSHHLNTLKYTLNFLASVASHSNVNHMDSWNLGVVMAPNLLPPEKDVIDKNEKASNKIVQHQAELIQMLIDHAPEVGTLPPCQLEVPLSVDDAHPENVVDMALRKKKRRSMHEVVDCLRKRVVHTPLDDGTKMLPRSASKRKGDNLSQPQPSPCKKRAVGQMSLPTTTTVSGSHTPITPLSSQINHLNICGSSPFASPTPKKGFGLLGRRSRHRKSKCFASAYKRNTGKIYNNKQDHRTPKCVPDPFVKSSFNDLIMPSPSEQQITLNYKNIVPKDMHTIDGAKDADGAIEVASHATDPNLVQVQEETWSVTQGRSSTGFEISSNSTDSGTNSPIQFTDIENSARKMCLRRGRPNTTKMGLKSPFVSRCSSEPPYSSTSTASPSISPVSTLNLESKAEALILESSLNSPTPELEPPQKLPVLRRSLSESDSSLRKFLTEKILNALSFSSSEFSLGSSCDDVLSTAHSVNQVSQLAVDFPITCSSSQDIMDNPEKTPDLSAIDSAEKDSTIERQSFSNDWSHCNSNFENPFSTTTFTSDIGTVESICSVDEQQNEKSKTSPNAKRSEMTNPSPLLMESSIHKCEETPLSPFINTKENIGKQESEKRLATMTCSTPIRFNNAWMDEKEFKALLDDVQTETEGTKRESILQLRQRNAGRVRANVEHYDKIAFHGDSPYPNIRNDVFGRNGLVTRSVRERSSRNIDSQGFVVPKGVPTSIKRCSRNMNNKRAMQDSPTVQRGSSLKTARHSCQKLIGTKNEQKIKSPRGKLCFSEDHKENIP